MAAAQLPAQITPEILQKGMQALQSGAVDPQTALAQYKKHFSPYSVKTEGPANQAGQGPAPAPAAGPVNAQANQAQVMAQVPQPGSQPPGAVVPVGQPPLTAPPLKQLSPQVPKSGMSETETSKAVADHKTTNVQGNVLPSDAYGQVEARAHALDAYQNEMQGQDKLQGMLDMEKNRENPTNLRGLAAMVDAWKGGSLLAGMPAAQTPQDKAKLLLDYSQKLQQDKKGIMDSFTGFLKGNKSGASTDMSSLVQSIQDQQAAQDPYKYMRQQSPEMRMKWVNDAANRQLAPLQKEYEGVQHGQDLLASAKSVADLSAVDAYLKSQVGGRVTNYDLQRQKGDQSWGPRISQAVETVTQGTLTPQNRAEYAQALQTIGEAINGERSNRLSQVRDFSGTINNDPAQTEQLLRGYYRGGDEKPKGAAAQAVKETEPGGALVPRKLKDGTIGLFDPKTKEFVRHQ